MINKKDLSIKTFRNPVAGRPPTKETGFLATSAGDSEVFSTKTRFLATRE
jgi:hypothetical protein